MDTVLLLFFFNWSIQYSCSFLNKIVLLLFQVDCFISEYCSLAVEDYTKCELIGRGSPRHLNTFLTSLLLAVHYTHINTCYVAMCYFC